MKRLIEVFVFFAVTLGTGCAAPESVKRSAVMTEKAVTAAQEKVPKDHEAQVDLAAAKDSAGAVAFYLGQPDAPVIYTPEAAHALASEARVEAAVRRAMESFAMRIVEQVTGKFPKVPEPKEFPIEQVLAGFAGVYASFKGAGFAAKKISNMRKNGNAPKA